MAKFDVVFEGGGAKGVALVGALQVLVEECGHSLRRLVGTSAGAITATLAAAGMAPSKMLGEVTERLDGRPRFQSFMDTPEAADFSEADREGSLTHDLCSQIDLPLVPRAIERRLDAVLVDQLLGRKRFRQLFSFVERGGLYAGNAFLAWLREKLEPLGIGPDDTLSVFAKPPFRDLSVVASDTTGQELLMLNHRTAPDVPVAWAVRMSMSIPLVWQEVVWRKEWGTYQGRPKAGHVIVDGGVLSNFPIRLIGRSSDRAVRAENREVMGQAEMSGAEILGLLIDETQPVPGEPEEPPASGIGGSRTVQRISRLIDTMTGSHDKAAIQVYSRKICRLPAKGFGTLEFDLAGPRLENFLDASRRAMRAHLEDRGLSGGG